MEKNFYKILNDLGLDDASLKPLYKDASNRTYYRIVSKSGTLVLMTQDSPISEDDANLASIEDFKGLGVRVPKIHRVFNKEGVLIQEDLGDIHLESVKDRTMLRSCYISAVNILLSFQKAAHDIQCEGKELKVFKTSFTSEKFLSELKMTTEYYINKYMDRVLSDKTKSKLNDFYIDLVSKMMEQPFLLQHRDYHSRNIMIKDGDLFIIDLQDARLGPLAYDMASLMIDPYIDLDDDIVNDCLEHYYKGISNFIPCSYDEFIYIYRLCFLQRGIKILGTFAYQKMKNSKDKYLPYIPVTVSKLNDICGYFPEWESIIKGTVLA